MPPTLHKVFAWIACNVELLFVRTLGLIVRTAPCKVLLIEIAGLFAGLLFLLIQFQQWKKIARFARHTGSTLPTWQYIIRFFIERGKKRVWEELSYEEPSLLKSYIAVGNVEVLAQASKAGNGVIVLGADYGPGLCTFLLQENNINIKTLACTAFVEKLQNTEELGLKFLISKKISFLTKSNTLVAQGSERELVRHLKNGGAISMRELPNRDFLGTGITAKFFGLPVHYSNFPFELGLRYKAPVFFYFFEKSPAGGYRLCFIPSGEFSTPQTGINKYTSFFQAQIIANPFMWAKVPIFFEMVSEKQ